MVCPSCSAENRETAKFCGECGSSLAAACAACGAANDPSQQFCNDCGNSLARAATSTSPPGREDALPAPSAQRRLVSVLFADLVGFTAASEHRDAEETRELLTRYFDSARKVVERYGGTVEKFIGDAVMAVWGTPVAQEDDAERAVRTALDLVAAVSALGTEVGAPELRLRAAVLTGEAAVTLGAQGQGMVAGDIVNTASRIQSIAEPGAVLVGESTRRATEAAIAYEQAGEHELKGKAQPFAVWRALRVTAGRRGEGRSGGLEAPFVGRDGEFRLLKDLFHATADEQRARLVSVVGVAGIGKSRLAWEFEKYIDGLADDVWWHRGRSLAYGEAVAYWALAEMVRMRARISEEEEPESARVKLQEAIELQLEDPEERAWVEPRLQHLLGLAARVAPDREDLFSAWRLFFERMAERGPLIMVFEDLHWADSALVAFIEYLLDWSRSHPIYVVSLARPELAERHPAWAAGKRSFTSLFLEPLSDEAMEKLLCGLAPGLPDELRERIRRRADGIPLYAVETVRMLLDRNLLEQDGNEYRPTGEIAALEVPETLHALIAARLDGVSREERRLLEDASVLGKTFTKHGLATLSGRDEAALDPVLASLLRKEILTLQTDVRSPERGQYGFLQALVQKVAYETLSRKERKSRHLAAAMFLETGAGLDEDEIAEVIAAHYLDAYRADPDAADAPEIKARACARLATAGERAASLAATEEAQRAFQQAAGLADEPLARARLLERAGQLASARGRFEEAESLFEEAAALFEGAGQSHDSARVSAQLGEVIWSRGRIEEAIARMEGALAFLSEDEPDADLATLAAQLGRLRMFEGRTDLAMERIEQALETAESLRLPDVVAEALITKGLILKRRPHESQALLRQALEIGLEYDLPSAAIRAHYNLAFLAALHDRFDELRSHLEGALVLARKRGDRTWEGRALLGLAETLYLLGEWDEALAYAAEIPEATRSPNVAEWLNIVGLLTRMGHDRDDPTLAKGLADTIESAEASGDLQASGALAFAQAAIARAGERYIEALDLAAESLRLALQTGNTSAVADSLVEGAEAAFALGDGAKVGDLLLECEALLSAGRSLLLRAHVGRFRTRLAALEGDDDLADQGFRTAAASFRELALPFWLAVTLLEHGEWLTAHDRREEAEPAVREAVEVFERLGARRWLERAGSSAAARSPVT